MLVALKALSKGNCSKDGRIYVTSVLLKLRYAYDLLFTFNGSQHRINNKELPLHSQGKLKWMHLTSAMN